MMRRQSTQLLAYVGVAVLAVGAAFLISLSLLGRSRAQENTGTPSDSAQPTQTQSPPAANAPSPGTAELSAPSSTSGLAELEGFLEPFIYDIVNRRDPFLAYAEYIPSDEGPSRPMSPAQRFPIEELRLVGVMWDVKDPRAMFMDPDQEVLMLGRDESIGNRNGYIAAIREGEVVVVEAIRKRGDIIYRTKVLRIER